MKIGIATFQWSDNYGAVFQSFALQTVLKNAGHEVHIINYQPQPILTGLSQYIAKSPKALFPKWEDTYKRKLFERFRSKYLYRTKEVFHSGQDLIKIQNNFEILITGSDQVWNPKWLIQQDGLWDLCFLRFAGKHIKLISYAASFGHADISTLKQEWKSKIEKDIRNFDAVSVREHSGISMVKLLASRNDAMHVVDPTLLLNKDYYNKLIGNLKKRKHFLFSYMLLGLEKDALFIENQISNIYKLKIIKCDAKKMLFHPGYKLPNPIGWLNLIRNAQIVITNSFHGVVFCLIFHTPFFALLLDGEIGTTNGRIIDLLNEVGLTSRMLTPLQANKIFDYEDWIDWIKVDNVLEGMIQQSINFLNLNLTRKFS